MKTALRISFVAALLMGVVSGAKVASAQSFSFPVGGFTTANVCANGSTVAGCQVFTNGSPARPVVASGGVLRLTTANQNQHGSAWFFVQQPLSTGFTTAFQFQVSNTNSCSQCSFPADGLALIIQNDPAGTGALGYAGNGQNLSYGNNDNSTASGPGQAIANSLAVELDTHQNADFGDPDGNHIAVQSCGPNNANTLTPNSADHNYICANGKPAKLALQSLPAGVSLSDTKTHTITVNYLPPGNCTSACNNFAVYLDSTLVVQTTLDITQQLHLSGNGGAFIGFTAATGSIVENNDIVSWTFSSLPLAPITINQPLQTTATNFNYTPELSAITDYSQSGLGNGAFQGVFMQGTVQTITDQQFADLVNNTPFQGSTCQHQDTGNGSFACVLTTDLCTTSSSSTASGANCPSSGTNALINVSNTYNLDPAQKPIIAPGYIMGKDTALACGAAGDNICKGLTSIFSSISGDAATTNGRTNNFNSVLVPILGSVQPTTSVTTTPALNGGWTNSNVTVTFNGTDVVPPNNTNPPASIPTVASINYSAAGANLPTLPSGTLTGPTGSIVIPATNEGSTVLTFLATDTAGTVESITTNSGLEVSSASPTFTIQFDKTAPMLNCVGPNTPPSGWVATDVLYNCSASDAGSGLAGGSLANFLVSTNVPDNTENSAASIAAVTVQDVAGNTSLPQGPLGPFQVDKKAPAISAPVLSVPNPSFGQSGVTASYTCTDGGSGVVLCAASQQGAQISPTASIAVTSPADTSSVGPHTFTAYSQDLVGHVTSTSISYNVGKAIPTIAWATPAPVNFGTPLTTGQLNASASVPGTFAYTPATGTVLAAGSQLLSVLFTPTDSADFASVSAQVTLIVNKVTPIVTWATPAPINAGTPLSASQLNATASVPGTFAYTPAAGTLLPAGNQALSVTFTPTDSVDYTQASKQVTLVVVAQGVLRFIPSTLNFGNVPYKALAPLVETVTNTGSASVKISNIAVALTATSDRDDFTFLSACPTTLNPNKSCVILVVFFADDSGTRNANLVFTDNAAGSPQTVPMVGTVNKHK